MGGGTWGRGAQVMIVNEWDCVQCAPWGDVGEGIPASPSLLPLYPRLPFRTDPAGEGGCEEGPQKDTPSTLVGADSPRQDHDPDRHARHRANFQPPTRSMPARLQGPENGSYTRSRETLPCWCPFLFLLHIEWDNGEGCRARSSPGGPSSTTSLLLPRPQFLHFWKEAYQIGSGS